jgi:hypothetical protein
MSEGVSPAEQQRMAAEQVRSAGLDSAGLDLAGLNSAGLVSVDERGALDSELPLLLLTSAVLTAPGDSQYSLINIARARDIIQGATSVSSHIGHKPMADWITDRLGYAAEVDRSMTSQLPGQQALVVRLRTRRTTPGDVEIFSDDDVELGLLTRRDFG